MFPNFFDEWKLVNVPSVPSFSHSPEDGGWPSRTPPRHRMPHPWQFHGWAVANSPWHRHRSQRSSRVRVTSFPMPTNLHRYYGAGYSHFITTSCYQRRPLLGPPRARDFSSKLWSRSARGHQFVVVGYVVMPEPSFTSTKSPDPHRHRGPPVKPPRVGHPVAERWETSRPLLSFSPRIEIKIVRLCCRFFLCATTIG